MCDLSHTETQENISGLKTAETLCEGERKKENEVVQSCLTLCDPMDSILPRLICPWDFLGKSTGVGCHLELFANSKSIVWVVGVIW